MFLKNVGDWAGGCLRIAAFAPRWRTRKRDSDQLPSPWMDDRELTIISALPSDRKIACWNSVLAAQLDGLRSA